MIFSLVCNFKNFNDSFQDCKAKRPGQGGPPVVSANSQAKIDEEYLSLMAELGEGPPANKDSDSTQTSGPTRYITCLNPNF